MTLANAKYYPFIGKLTVGDNNVFGEYWINGEYKFIANFNFAVHDLTMPVVQYCNMKGTGWSGWFKQTMYASLSLSKGHDGACKIVWAPSCYETDKERACIDEYKAAVGTHQTFNLKINEMYHEAYDCWWDWCSYRYKWKLWGDYQWNVR